MRNLITVFGLVFSTLLLGQALPEVDLLFRYEIIPSRMVSLGTNVTFRYMVTNRSAIQPAIGEIVFIPPIPPIFKPYDVFNPSGQLGNCGDCLGSNLCIRTDVIPPGETRFCELYFVAAQYVGIPIRIRASVIHAQGTATDPNPSNNTDQVTIGILPPTPVQVPLSPLSYGLMGLLMLGLGGLAVRRS